MGQDAASRVAKRSGHDHFFECCHLRPFVAQALAEKTWLGVFWRLEFHALGSHFPARLDAPALGAAVLQRGCRVSLVGVLVFWAKPFLLGVVGNISRHCGVQCFVDLSFREQTHGSNHRCFKLLQRLRQFQPTQFIRGQLVFHQLEPFA